MNDGRDELMTHDEFLTLLRSIRFTMTHSKDLEEAIKNFDEITDNAAIKKEAPDTDK